MKKKDRSEVEQDQKEDEKYQGETNMGFVTEIKEFFDLQL
jgi:hypothetical protein